MDRIGDFGEPEFLEAVDMYSVAFLLRLADITQIVTALLLDALRMQQNPLFFYF